MAKNKIVIVDDDKDFLAPLVSAFRSHGFETLGISTGAEAMDYLIDKKNADTISLIILDRLLPDMDGLDILKQYTTKFRKKTPILIMSVLSSDEEMISGFNSGAVDYVAKPVSIPVLIAKATAFIEMHK